jgi:hypothetical protein
LPKIKYGKYKGAGSGFTFYDNGEWDYFFPPVRCSRRSLKKFFRKPFPERADAKHVQKYAQANVGVPKRDTAVYDYLRLKFKGPAVNSATARQR